MIEGNYSVYWIDTYTGAIVATGSYAAPARKIDAPAEPFIVKTPKFKRDIALVATLNN